MVTICLLWLLQNTICSQEPSPCSRGKKEPQLGDPDPTNQ